jgi:hypothetical protein
MERIKDVLIGPVCRPADWRDRADRDDIEAHRERTVYIYKEGEDQPSSGFQKGDEIWEKGYLQKLYLFHPGEQE